MFSELLTEIGQDPIKRFAVAAVSYTAKEKADTLRAQYTTLDDEQLWEFATTNEIDPIIAHVLSSILPVEDVPDHWIQTHNQYNTRISTYLAEVDDIAHALAEQQIPIIALKNGGIARGIYPCAGCCPMGDVDLLINKHDAPSAHQILLYLGFQFEFRNPQEEASLQAAEHAGGTEYWKFLPNTEKFWLELQWHAIAGRWINENQEPPTPELIRRSIPIANTPVRLLAPEDNLLQVCLHTAKHSYIRAPGFRLHLDVERIVNLQTINWNTFVTSVDKLNVKTPVYFSLVIPKQLFGTPIPDDIIRELEPPHWKRNIIARWLQEGGLFNPHERKFSKLRYILFSVLLYDHFGDLWCGLFPSKTWMKTRYNFENDLYLPYYHTRRLVDLIFRRLAT